MQYAFDAAKRSGYRTWFFFPSLDPSDQLTELTFEDSAKKLNWLYNNCPAASGVINGMAREEVDTGIWPRAKTSSRTFNKAVTDAFENDCSDPRFFDEAGELNFDTAQEAIRRNIYMLHDMFGQFLRPGEGSSIPTVNFIPSWQVGNARKSGSDSGPEWINGTLANKFGRITKFRVFTNKKRTESEDVPADDMLHFHDAMWKGQRRGLSCLTAAVRKFYSLDDLDRAANSGELLRQRVAYQITKSNMDDDEPTLVPGGEVVETVEVENPDGTKSKLHIQRIHSADGADIDIADLPPGREIKMVESTKGGAAIEWSEYVLRDIARCTPYPPEYIFNLGGITQGTLARMVQKRVQRAKNSIRQHQLVQQFCKRWYHFWLWQNILKGRFNGVGVPDDWWLVKWIMPADDSVDVGREGHLFDDRLDSGKMTLSVYHGMQNEDAEDVEDEIIADRIRRLMKLEDARAKLENRAPDYTGISEQVEYDLIFRESKVAGLAATAAVTTSNPDDEPAPLPQDRPGNASNRNGHIPPGRLAHV